MKSTHARAAAEIRAKLKANGIKASVRSESYSGGSSVRVYLTDPMPAVVNQVTEFAERYQYGSFDGMQDLYEYTNVNKDLPQVKYVFVECHYSDQLRQAAWDHIRDWYCLGDDVTTDANQAHKVRIDDVWGSCVIHRVLGGRECNLWQQLKPRVRVAA